MTTKNFSTVISAGVVAATLSLAAQPAEAFVITNTSANWDNVTLYNGDVIGSAGEAANATNKVKFLNADGIEQVRWGTAAYGTEVTTTRDFDWNDYYNGHNYYYGNFTNSAGEADYGYHMKDTEVVVTYANQSGLGYQGVSDLNLDVGEVFNLGSLTHFNQTIWGDGLDGTSADFSLDLDFGDSSIGSQTFDFTFSIDETVNSLDVCPYETTTYHGCSDKISWDFAIDQEQSFTYENEEYTLELVGFADTLSTSGALNTGDIVNDFISQESADNSASLFARIVKLDTTIEATEEIPEPAALLGLAGFGLYFASSRKKKAAELAA